MTLLKILKLGSSKTPPSLCLRKEGGHQHFLVKSCQPMVQVISRAVLKSNDLSVTEPGRKSSGPGNRWIHSAVWMSSGSTNLNEFDALTHVQSSTVATAIVQACTSNTPPCKVGNQANHACDAGFVIESNTKRIDHPPNG